MAANKNAKNAKNNAKKTSLSKSTVIAFAVAIVFFILLGTRFFSTDKGSQAGTGSDYTANADYYADIEIENYGTITVALDATAAPITVENFVTLAKSGFYDGLTFHRIIEGYMMQGGDPNGNGTGGSGTNIKGEFSSNGVDNPLSHTYPRRYLHGPRQGQRQRQFPVLHHASGLHRMGWQLCCLRLCDRGH